MLGIPRFANAHCNPNCEFDLMNEQKVIKLGTKNEIFIKFGEDFFDAEECLCSGCETKRKQTPSELIEP